MYCPGGIVRKNYFFTPELADRHLSWRTCHFPKLMSDDLPKLLGKKKADEVVNQRMTWG